MKGSEQESRGLIGHYKHKASQKTPLVLTNDALKFSSFQIIAKQADLCYKVVMSAGLLAWAQDSSVPELIPVSVALSD
jgi:hypothetical protein